MTIERFKHLLKDRIFSKDAVHWYINYLFRFLRKFGLVGDKLFIKNQYRCVMGEKLNIKKPRTFNQKLQWLKLYDRKPIYTDMVDKCAAKLFVDSKLNGGGTQYQHLEFGSGLKISNGISYLQSLYLKPPMEVEELVS